MGLSIESKPSDGHDLIVDCQTCGAKVAIEPHMRTARCAYCASPQVVERPRDAGLEQPAFALPFIFDKERASAKVKRWIRKHGLFARSGFKAEAVAGIRGLYLPVYLYGAEAHAHYSADIGENYTETETYTTTDSNGNTTTRTRTVVRTEWRQLQGLYSTWIRDVLVTASAGVENSELEAVEPFDLRALGRFTPAVIAGWAAEEATMGRSESTDLAREEARHKVETELAAFMPGDHHRNLHHETSVRNEMADLCLMPIWVFAVRYDEDEAPLRVLVNGQTGLVGGKVPRSWIKILIATGLGLAVVALIVLAIAGS